MDENTNKIKNLIGNMTEDVIEHFLNGRDEFRHIINIECGYNDDRVSIIYRKEDGNRYIKLDDFKPFVWAKNSACIRMFNGDRSKVKQAMNLYGIGVKKLIYKINEEDEVPDRLENGYKFLFYAKNRMSYSTFMRFFDNAGTPIYGKSDSNDIHSSKKEFLAVSPVEQYMIASGKRMFKGYENYDELHRLIFDLETQGLNPRTHAIDQIGIRTNKGYEKILTIEGEGKERLKNEFYAIKEFLEIILEQKPDIVIGYNSEAFDWDFLIVRLDMIGYMSMEQLTEQLGFHYPIYKKKKKTTLKLGGEVEYYNPTIMWGTPIIDGLHAVRRAQAIDSNMKSANLKYITKYSNLNKRNRVYVPGDKITDTWNVRTNEYAFNNENGDWYHISEKHPLKEGYEEVSGKYIVERYLLDDLWETDKVELRYNESNFLLCKLLPTTYQRACTMGTAGTWKLIMLAWSYENDLAVPAFGFNKKFTGGLSRLLRVGYVDNIAKLDYNSLYPSIMLTWNIKNSLDISGAMLSFLGYILSQREKFKALKKKAGKEAKRVKALLDEFNGDEEHRITLEDELQHWESEENSYDKKQLPFKIFGNSMFGSYGSPGVFPWGDLDGAECITSTGRQALRLMISWFTNIGYTPIVGDSFTEDTPLFIKYDDNGYIDIKPIKELIDENNIHIDGLGREYDYSKKSYKVLCRSGWLYPSYIYRHKTDKDIYEVKTDENMAINVTEDHSLFDKDKNKIKPSEINENTELENYKNSVDSDSKYKYVKDFEILLVAKLCAKGALNRIPMKMLNMDIDNINKFLNYFNETINNGKYDLTLKTRTKTFLAGLNFLCKKLHR